MEENNPLQPGRSPIRYFLIAIAIIGVDQVSKLLVHNLMYIHQEVTLLGYADGRYGFKLHYLLNPGMAFGIRWKSEFGKLALTLFRIVAMTGISIYLFKAVHRGAHKGFLVALALILGGAVGNVIDSIFYGVLLHNELPGSVTPWFHGQVIDMLFFPLFEINWPSWFPDGLAGESFLFFSPVFNIADSSIFIGVAMILLFQKKFFEEPSLADSVEQLAGQSLSIPANEEISGESSLKPETEPSAETSPDTQGENGRDTQA